LFDQGILLGSAAITMLLLLFSALGLHQFIDLSEHQMNLQFAIPFAIGAAGVVINFVGGELDRKQLLKKFKPDRIYRVLFYFSVGIMIFAVVLGGVMNPRVALSGLSEIPYIAAGGALVILIAFVLLKIRSSKPLPTDPKKEPVIV
jgi:hypothetical protein